MFDHARDISPSRRTVMIAQWKQFQILYSAKKNYIKIRLNICIYFTKSREIIEQTNGIWREICIYNTYTIHLHISIAFREGRQARVRLESRFQSCGHPVVCDIRQIESTFGRLKLNPRKLSTACESQGEYNSRSLTSLEALVRTFDKSTSLAGISASDSISPELIVLHPFPPPCPLAPSSSRVILG